MWSPQRWGRRLAFVLPPRPTVTLSLRPVLATWPQSTLDPGPGKDKVSPIRGPAPFESAITVFRGMTALRGTISLLGPSAGVTWRTLRACQPQKGACRLESCLLTCPCIAQQNPGIPSLLPPAYPPFSTGCQEVSPHFLLPVLVRPSPAPARLTAFPCHKHKPP